MSTNYSPAADEQTAGQLRTLIEPTIPSMALDPTALLQAGHRHRNRRTAALSTLSALAVGAVVIAGVQFAGGGRADGAPPAGWGQTPHSIGTEQVAELAPGVFAANLPVDRTLANGMVVRDIGMSAPWSFDGPSDGDLERLDMVAFPDDPGRWSQIHQTTLAFSPDRAAALGFIREAALSTYAPASIAWVRGSVRTERPGATKAANAELSLTDGSTVYLGHVPAWLPDPRVRVYSPRGFRLADGSLVHSLEVPTFAAPGVDGGLLYLVRVLNEQAVVPASSGPAQSMVTLFLGSDGTVETGLGCDGAVVEVCAQSAGPQLLAAAGLNQSTEDPSVAPTWLADYPSAPSVAELAPGITAASKPSVSRLDDGRYLADTGLDSGGYQPGEHIGVVQMDTDWINFNRDPSQPLWTGDTAITIAFDQKNIPRSGGMPFAWSSREKTIDWYLLAQTRTTRVMSFGSEGPTGTQQAIAGIAPAGLTDPSLDLCYTNLDMTRMSCLRDVPLFRAPTADGREMFVVRFDQSLGYDSLAYGLVFKDRSTGLQVPFLTCQASDVDPANPTIPAVRSECVPPKD